MSPGGPITPDRLKCRQCLAVFERSLQVSDWTPEGTLDGAIATCPECGHTMPLEDAYEPQPTPRPPKRKRRRT